MVKSVIDKRNKMPIRVTNKFDCTNGRSEYSSMFHVRLDPTIAIGLMVIRRWRVCAYSVIVEPKFDCACD